MGLEATILKLHQRGIQAVLLYWVDETKDRRWWFALAGSKREFDTWHETNHAPGGYMVKGRKRMQFSDRGTGATPAEAAADLLGLVIEDAKLRQEREKRK